MATPIPAASRKPAPKAAAPNVASTPLAAASNPPTGGKQQIRHAAPNKSAWSGRRRRVRSALAIALSILSELGKQRASRARAVRERVAAGVQGIRKPLADGVQVRNLAVDLQDLIAHALLQGVRAARLAGREPEDLLDFIKSEAESLSSLHRTQQVDGAPLVNPLA